MNEHDGHRRITIERISVTTIRRVKSERGYCNVCGHEVDLVAEAVHLGPAKDRMIPAIDMTTQTQIPEVPKNNKQGEK